MRRLNYELKQLCRHNRDGSFSTRAQRERRLTRIANDLHHLGYRQMNVRSLKPKHVPALIQEWHRRGLSTQTIKVYMATLRWWAEKVDRASVVARSNNFYGIARRSFVTNESKAKDVTDMQLALISNPHIRMSVELQRAFGLRREEALKFQPAYADRGDHLLLKGSWTKGGKPRIIPVRTEAQREVLERARALVGRGSMIPPSQLYHRQIEVYKRQVRAAGLSRLHGLRHRYAQLRYEELTGWPAPAAGGPKANALKPQQREADRRARLIISRELGHEREQITTVYCGR